MIVVKEKTRQNEGFTKIPFSTEIAVLEILKNSKASILSKTFIDVARFINNAMDKGVHLTATRLTAKGAMDIGKIDLVDDKNTVFIDNMGTPTFNFSLEKTGRVYQVVFGSATGYF